MKSLPRTPRHRMAGALGWLFLLVPGLALARAGGGGGYSGGGGGGGGSYSGGSFGGGGGTSGDGEDLMKLIEFLFIKHPVLGLTTVVFVTVIVLINRHGERKNELAQVRARILGPPLTKHTQDGVIVRMRALDPHFDPQGFAARFRSAFFQIQAAWQQQDMQPVQHFVSDGIYERFSLQILEQRSEGYRDHMEKIQVLSILFASAESTGLFDTLTVRVEASAVDYRVSLKTGKHVSGEQSAECFAEFWSFIRRSGVVTQAGKPGLVEGSCPNCSSPVQFGQHGTCPSCQALLRSGQHDWVLAEITQASEWRPGPKQGDATALAYRSGFDPGFDVQHLEDRASVIFWRKVMADRLDQAGPLLKMATETVCADYGAAGSSDHRVFIGDCAVGSVDLKGILTGDEADHALMEVRWSGSEHRATSKGVKRDEGSWRRYRSLQVLMRRRGVQTDLNRAIDSAHCPSCGGAESDLSSHACQYCGAVLNTGEHDWVLAEVLEMRSARAKSWLDQASGLAAPAPPDASAGAPSQSDALTWMIYVLAADGQIHENERATILDLAEKEGLSPHQVDGLVDAASKRELTAATPPDARTAKIWLERMADVALADGVVEDSERSILVQLGGLADMQEADVDLLIGKRRAQRNQAARLIFPSETGRRQIRRQTLD